MSVAEVSRSLYMEQRMLDSCINAFVSAGILVRESNQQYSYMPNTAAAAAAIDEIARLYSERRTGVINFIYASPMDSFSDAFKLTKENE